MSMGAAMAKALAVFRLNPTEEGYRLALEAASVCLSDLYVDSVEWSLEGLTKLLTKGFDVALNKTVATQLENEDVMGCELSIGEGRIDLVSRLKSTKGIIVTDDKVRMQLRADYITKTLVEAEQDWQLWDYAARATEYYGEPVQFIRRHLIILSPKAGAHEQVFTISPEAIKQHQTASAFTWADMGRDELRALVDLEMNKTQCINKYGKCSMWDACHVLLRDLTKFNTIMDMKEK